MSTPAAQIQLQPNEARRLVVVQADSSKQVPTRIELIQAGYWPKASHKGEMTITLADLDQYVENFRNHVAMPKGLNKLAIDYKHDDRDIAAGWITNLERVEDTVYADVEWTPKGRQVLIDGEFKAISPAFFPSCLGFWRDPENHDVQAQNVLIGAGLTNIPFFKGLNVVMADNREGSRENLMYISADAKEQSMNIDELRVKDAAQVTADEKAFITANKEKLSTAEQEKFGLVEASNTNKGAEVTGVTDEQQSILASIESGEIVAIKATELAVIKASAEKTDSLEAIVKANSEQLAGMKKAEVKASVDAHVARGAIKASEAEKWTDLIVADPVMADMLANIGDNPLVAAGEVGKGEAANVQASDQLDAKVQEAMKADSKLTYGAALEQVMASTDGAELSKLHDNQLA